MPITTKQLLGLQLRGFVATMEKELGIIVPYNIHNVRFTNEAEKIRIEVEIPKPCRQKHARMTMSGGKRRRRPVTKDPHRWCSIANGHTYWHSERGGFWASFDRYGVEDSFYVMHDTTLDELRAILMEQVARVAKAREVSARSIDVPGLPYSVTPEGKQQIAEKLQKGSSHTWHPRGFGTARRISTRRERESTPLPEETAAFFGVEQLWMHSYEMD